MNFVRDVVDAAPADRRAVVELAADGSRREWTFGDVSKRAARLAGRLSELGVRREDVVMTVVPNRIEWLLGVLAALRLGAVALPVNPQSRASDLAFRLEAAKPALVLVDERHRAELEAARPACAVLAVPDESLFTADPARAVDLAPTDPALIIFTSGTSGKPKGIVHGQRYLTGQRLQARHWLDARQGDLVWCTAAAGWSKSARNAFLAPWQQGAAALIHDARFDPAERLEIVARERVDVLCMAPTEYRIVARRATLGALRVRSMVAAGEQLTPDALAAWHEATGVWIRDGFGQTETGQLTAMPAGRAAVPGSMGRPLPGISLDVVDGELVLTDPTTDPTFFVRYLDGRPAPLGPWRTGDRVRQDDEGLLFHVGRTDDLIISAGYRIAPLEVESALERHPAVAEVAVVGRPDDERGEVVRAVVVLRDGWVASPAMTRELQAHAREATAPYKYPRVVEYAESLPRTASGKLRRAALREHRPDA